LQDFGVILHQPLNLTKKRKKRIFGQIMNGPPVCLPQKSENAPTWRVRKHNFRPLFWGIFLPICCPSPHPTQTPMHPLYLSCPSSNIYNLHSNQQIPINQVRNNTHRHHHHPNPTSIPKCISSIVRRNG